MHHAKIGVDYQDVEITVDSGAVDHVAPKSRLRGHRTEKRRRFRWVFAIWLLLVRRSRMRARRRSRVDCYGLADRNDVATRQG